MALWGHFLIGMVALFKFRLSKNCFFDEVHVQKLPLDILKPVLYSKSKGISRLKEFMSFFCWNTVKLARAKLPANAGSFSCSSQVKRSHTQFTCVTCSLPVKTGKYTCAEAASTSRRKHATCLQAHAKLP